MSKNTEDLAFILLHSQVIVNKSHIKNELIICIFDKFSKYFQKEKVLIIIWVMMGVSNCLTAIRTK
jgi:hypothetical protein